MPCLKKCCFCCRLHTGTVVIGWFNVVYSAIWFIAFAVLLANIDSILKQNQWNQNFQEDSGFNSINNKWYQNQRLNNDNSEKFGIQVGCSFGLAVSFINGVSAVLLILGAIKKNRYLLLPWIIGDGISMVTSIIVTVGVFVVMCINFNFPALLGFFLSCLLCGFQMHLWLCVVSLFQFIREEEQRGDRTLLLSNQFVYDYSIQPSMQQQHPIQQQQQQPMIANYLPTYLAVA